jgi:transcriptional regulator with XRE-family HTH domain
MHGELPLRLRVLRAQRGWSIDRAAHEAGVTPETLSDAERGKRHPYLPTLRKLADAYGVDVEDLLRAEEREAAVAEKGKAPRGAGHSEASSAKQEPAAEERRYGPKEPLSPKMRRFHADLRRAQLERTSRYLDKLTEELRELAKEHHEPGEREQIFERFLHETYFARGVADSLAELREEAQELGGETQTERDLQYDLEHSIVELEKVLDRIGEIWGELGVEESAAEQGELEDAAELTEIEKVRVRRHRRERTNRWPMEEVGE